MKTAVVFALVAVALCAAGGAGASQLIDRTATGVRLTVNARGEALLMSRSVGQAKHVLVWGAANTRHPSSGRRQVKFRVDYSGRGRYWASFSGGCRRYD